MIETHGTPGSADTWSGGRAARRSRRGAPVAPLALWLTALLVGVVAAAAEMPPLPEPVAPAPDVEAAPPDAEPAPPDAEPAPPPDIEAPPPEAEPAPPPAGETAPPPAGETAPPPAGGTAPPPAGGTAPPPAGGAVPPPAGGTAPKPDAEPEPDPPPPPVPGEPLRLNFRDASLHAVLAYLSEATGLVIVKESSVEGRITIISRQPLDIDEAVALLDTVLKEKGYAAIQTGRNLRIVTLAQAPKENLPVFSGNDPSQIPVSDKLVTQIIPVRFADATKLRTDLAPLLPATATLSSNAASNALVLVDTQANIRRMVEIIQALDAQISGEAEIKVFQLEYADAASTATLITNLFKPDDQQAAQSARRFFPFGPGGRGDRGDRGQANGETQGRQQKVIASADTRTNALVVSAPPDLLKVISGIVKDLDSNPSEEEAVFTYRLKNANAKNLETVLNGIFSESGLTGGAGRTTTTAGGRGATQFNRGGTTTQRVGGSASDLVGQVYVVADEDTNSLLVRTASKHFERVSEIIEELDHAIPQVLIKVLIAEVTHEDELDLGTEFSVLNLQFGATVEGTGDLGGTDERPGGVVTATLNANLAATFNALQREGRLDVLSRPYILTSDNQAATITIGQEVPRITNSRITDTGQTLNTVEYEDVGIILNVTPHVNPDGLVIMDVAPEISSLSDTTVPISETVNATVYNKRSAETHVAILNGQTIVIGGLMEDRIIDAVRKVPGLGDIPLLGALFRRTAKQKVKTELLIFLTPHVAQRPEYLDAMSKDETAGLKAVREAGGNGAFQEHLESLRRGATPQLAGEDDEATP